VLEDGSVFEGAAVAAGTRFGEVVFNTSMTGYQEILTDPSYRGQIVIMTQPHIGNYGINAAVQESERCWVEGFVARQFTTVPSSHGSEGSLGDYLRSQSVPALDGLDTRAVVRRVREHGALRGVLTTERSDVAGLQAELAVFPSMAGRSLVDEVTCREAWRMEPPEGVAPRFRLAVYDFGVKTNILRHLAARGAQLTILPASTPASDCLALGVDGVVLSNGPGDPEPLVEVIAAVRQLVESGLPIFGICLGHQLLGLAVGGSTFKLKFGHHGGNQPVRVVGTDRILITSQNHGFAVDESSLPENVEPTHRSLFDGTLQGISIAGQPAFSFQGHPEASPGPHDLLPLFERFLHDMAGAKRSTVKAMFSS